MKNQAQSRLWKINQKVRIIPHSNVTDEWRLENSCTCTVHQFNMGFMQTITNLWHAMACIDQNNPWHISVFHVIRIKLPHTTQYTQLSTYLPIHYTYIAHTHIKLKYKIYITFHYRWHIMFRTSFSCTRKTWEPSSTWYLSCPANLKIGLREN